MDTRRIFLQLIPAGGAALLLSRPSAAQTMHLAETEPRAQAVGYVEDVARVDTRQFPKFRAGQVCFNCDLYLAKPTEPWAPCTLFPRRLVAGKGWCDAYRARSR